MGKQTKINSHVVQ